MKIHSASKAVLLLPLLLLPATFRSAVPVPVVAATPPPCPAGLTSPCVIRGPYLQIVTPTSVVVRWRTDVATDSMIQWGTSAGSLNSNVMGDTGTPTIEHELAATGLAAPATKYFYSVGTTSGPLPLGSGIPTPFFLTAPAVGSQAPIRVLAIGDFGAAGKPSPDPGPINERKVRDSYMDFTGQYQAYTNVWLMLGDNAYVSGTDSQFQTDIFDPTYAYQTLLRMSAPWPAIGNHDAAQSTNPALTLPYFLNFTMPTNGEAGGLPSGTEKYYSFDYGNVHFVCLDSQTASNRQPGSPMLNWLANDLSANTQTWTIAYWHHPPYSHGTHNSDTEIELIEMRTNVVPVLEAHGVDLVLTGHSHDYERTFLIDGHYGDHSTWDPSTMGVDLGTGHAGTNGVGAYRKPTIGPAPHEGAVYVVMGSSGEGCTGTGCNHMDYPAMSISVPSPTQIPPSGPNPLMGQIVLDIKGKRLDARMLREKGATCVNPQPPGSPGFCIDDYFTIIKGPFPSFSVGDVTVTEGDSGTKNAVFTVTLDPPADIPLHVDYATADGTALAGSDYLATSGTLAFPAGARSRTFSVPIVGDATPEPTETFLVQLQNADPGSKIVGGTAQGTILDNDTSFFAFSAANYSVGEAMPSAMITVKRTGGLAAAATIGYVASDGSATSAPPNPDYTPVTGTLTFAVGVTTSTFTVPIANDTLDEPDETVLLRLTSPSPPSLLGAQKTAVLTIVDNDVAGRIQLGAAAYNVVEPSASPTQAVITVRRIGGLASNATVHYDVSGGTAAPGTSYVPTAGDLTFDATGPGAMVKTIAVDILPDTVPAASGAETVNVTLSPLPSPATLGTPATAVLTILEAHPTLEFGAPAYSVKESAPSALVTVKRSGPLTGTVTVDYAATGGTATNASDYNLAPGTLTFGPGVTSRTFAVPILKDTLVEGNETVNLTLSNPLPPGAISLGTMSGTVLTIVDDDVAPTLQFGAASYTVSEGSPRATVWVKRSGSLAGQVTVDYMATDVTATNGLDYTVAPNPGTLTFAPGVTTKMISIPIVNDTLDEGTETATLALTNFTGGAVPGPQSSTTLKILDNEPTFQFAAAAYTVSEATPKAAITVKRTGSLAAQATVEYAVTGGTATNGADYTLASPGTLTFAPGVAIRTISVPIVNDNVDEPAETVELTLGNPSPIALGTPSVTTLTITDNDVAGKVQFSAASYSVDEGGGTATISVTRSGGTSGDAKVDYAVRGGTATNGADYTLAPGTLTFGPGEMTKTLTIPIVDDTLAEGNESVILGLTANPSGGLALGPRATATLWIVDND